MTLRTSTPWPKNPRCSRTAAGSHPPLPRFDHVIVVVLENKSQSNLLGSDDAPNFNALAKKSAVLSHCGGVAPTAAPVRPRDRRGAREQVAVEPARQR